MGMGVGVGTVIGMVMEIEAEMVVNEGTWR